jgi:hypothetical protein
MAEYVVHDHDSAAGSGSGFFMGMVLLAVVLFLVFFYGIPLLRTVGTSTTPQVNVPGSIDVNVKQK